MKKTTASKFHLSLNQGAFSILKNESTQIVNTGEFEIPIHCLGGATRSLRMNEGVVALELLDNIKSSIGASEGFLLLTFEGGSGQPTPVPLSDVISSDLLRKLHLGSARLPFVKGADSTSV